MPLTLGISTRVPFKGHLPLPKISHLDWRCTTEWMDRPLKFVPQLLPSPHLTCPVCALTSWIPSFIPKSPTSFLQSPLPPNIFRSCLDLTYKWPELLLHFCAEGREESWLMRTHETSGWLANMSSKQQELDHAQILERDAQDCCLSVPFRYLHPSFSCVCAGLI